MSPFRDFDDVRPYQAVNLLPAHIEQVLLDSGYFAEAAVFGLEDAHWGQTVAAAVIVKEIPPVARPETWREFLRGKHAPMKFPATGFRWHQSRAIHWGKSRAKNSRE